MPNQETTAVASETGQVLESGAASTETQTHEAVADTSAETRVPEKFVGKSADEIARSYTELERTYGKVSGEKAQLQKEREERDARIQALEAELQNRSQRSSAPSREVEQVDPFSDFEKVWDSGDPKEAVKRTISQLKERGEADRISREGASHYHRLKQSDQDFQRREPDMAQLAQRYQHLVNPKFANSPEIYDLLHLAARGLRLEEYTREAVEKASVSSKTVRAEKQKAFSETGGAHEERSVEFGELSRDQMRAALEKLE